MNEVKCRIEDIKNISGKEYFIILCENDNQEYIIPTDQLLKYNVKVGENHIFEKQFKEELNKYFLKFKPEIIEHKYYKCNQIYDFEIVKFEAKLNKKNEEISIISVQDIDKNIITVLGLKWQKSEIWEYNTLKCEVERILPNGIPRLINRDNRHPLFEIGQEYDFKVISEKEKITTNGKFNYYELLGIDNCIHDVNMTQNQILNQIKPDYVKCRVNNITTKLRLVQVIAQDPFFVSIEKIVCDNYLKNKYFDSLFLDASTQSSDITQLIEQYNSKSAFWVFTFTDKVLQKLFHDRIEIFDYKNAKEINYLILTFEEWIIEKGIIDSIPDEIIREKTKSKAKNEFEHAKVIDSVLSVLNKNDYDIFEDDHFKSNTKHLLARFYFLIKYSNFELIDCNMFIKKLKEILNLIKNESESEFHYLNSLLIYISFNKKKFISENESTYFSLSSSKFRAVEFSNKELKYLTWSYGEILIAQFFSLNEYFNILCGQLLKLFTKTTYDIKEKECLLFNSFNFFDNYQSSEIPSPFLFNESLTVDFKMLGSDFSKCKNDDCWNELEKLFKKNSTFNVNLTKKSKTGFEVSFNNLKGFLPYHHIKDKKLKNYPFENSDFTITAKCLVISKPFNFFIIEQIAKNDSTINYKNNNQLIINSIYNAIITNIVNYGLFLVTEAGEGLLHITEIFDFEWNYKEIEKYFKIGQKIKVILNDISDDDKVSFSFCKMKEHDFNYYNDFIEQVIFNNSTIFFEVPSENEQNAFFDTALNEKAFCIEQYAVLQTNIDAKLQNFQIAKQFYTNAQNARSFLINIYTSYFDVLLKIKTIIDSGSLNNFTEIKKNAQEIKDKINKKTIDTFPDSDKLIFFLDIISMFNETDDTIHDLLFGYINNFKFENHNKDLKTIAKVTLANNLLISESKEESDFSIKNLRIIYDFLSNGILSLEETIEDKNARALKEDILYWKERIKEDESETLEFKSSFFTPYPSEERLKTLKRLNDIEIKSDKNKIEIDKIIGDLARKSIIHSAMKTLVAFANSSGGVLLIGVDNDKNIVGLEKEYLSTNPKLQYQNRDGFGLFFDDVVKKYIGDSFSSLMKRKFLKLPEGDILIIQVEPSTQEVFLLKNEEGKDSEELYIRNLSSSKELKGSELSKFIKNKYHGQLIKRVEEKMYLKSDY